MAVTVADVNSPTKTTRFLGICIQRGGCGLRAWFILRNVVDRQGIEVLYEMYCPLIQKIEVLRLEKRLDESLLYLRDALPEYSTFPFDMEPELRVDNAVVPINPLKVSYPSCSYCQGTVAIIFLRLSFLKVKLRPRPWLERWERQDLKGVQDLGLPQKFYDRAAQLATPWVKYDLMLQYRQVHFCLASLRFVCLNSLIAFTRNTIPAEEQETIYAEVYPELQKQDLKRRLKRRRGLPTD